MKKLVILSILLVSNLLAIEVSDFINKDLCGKKNKIIDKSIYSICYDVKMKGPKFVGYTLDGSLVHKGNYKKRPSFYTEKNLKKSERTVNGDFVWTGTDKGHMANHANWDYDPNQKVVVKTYSLANISPQYPNVNRKLWFKSEQAERDHAQRLGSLNVMNIVLYENPKNYLKRLPLDEAISLDKQRKKKSKKGFKEWSDSKIKSYLKKSETTLNKEIVIPTRFIKIMWNNEYNFNKCYIYDNVKNAKTKGDKLKHHQLDCKEVFNHFGI